MTNLNDFHDGIATEINRRVLQQAVDNGAITQEEIDNAPIVCLKATCQCNAWLEDKGKYPKCSKCGAPSVEVPYEEL